MKSKTFAIELEKRGIYETVKKISGRAKRVFLGVVTKLQKNQEFDLLSHENKEFNTNSKIKNSCKSVTSDEITTPETAPEPYQSEEQKRLWEDKEAVIY